MMKQILIIGTVVLLLIVVAGILLKKYKKKIVKIFKLISELDSEVNLLWKRELSATNQFTLNSIKHRLKNPKEKLHIVFLVAERAKWGSESLFKLLKEDERFKISIAVEMIHELSKDKAAQDHQLNEFQENYNFFSRIDSNSIKLSPKSIIENIQTLSTLKPDIIFYEQPWGRLEKYPAYFIGRSLGAYIPYSYLVTTQEDIDYHKKFFDFMWKYFSQSEIHKNIHLSYNPSMFDRLLVTGYPKLDVYSGGNLEANFYTSTHYKDFKKVIIYAPHHSISKKSIRLSTFEWNFCHIFELAKKHKDILWIYKPHPRMEKGAAESQVLTASEYREYLKGWRSLPNAEIITTGNYFNIFKVSSALITDCASFLAEYLPTGNPVIHLRRQDSIGFNSIGKTITESYYAAYNLSEFDKIFNEVILNDNDPMKKQRLDLISLVLPEDGGAAACIKDFILSEFFNKDNYI